MASPAIKSDGLKELWSRLRFVLLAIIIYRIGTHIPVPGIDPLKISSLFDQNQGTLLGLFNMFSGGALERMSIMALNVIPYITAAIVMNLLEATTPSLKKLFRQEINWDVPIFKKEDPSKTQLWSAYTAPCSADSGAPQMLYVVKEKDPKFVLGAIFSRALGYFGLQRTDGGPIYAAPCGTNTENTEKSHNDEEDILRKIGESVKITYGPLFQWIRTKRLV